MTASEARAARGRAGALRRAARGLGWLLLLVLLPVLGLLSPVAYVELACQPDEVRTASST